MLRKVTMASKDCHNQILRPGDIPFVVNWFEDPVAIARCLGLTVELPDIRNEDPHYWATFNLDHWRHRLIGKVDMTYRELKNDDPAWVRLKRLGGTIEAWFDLEEGIVFRCRAAAVARTASIIRQLASPHGLKLRHDGKSLVTASRSGGGTDIPSGFELAQLLVPAGFQWQRIHWILRSYDA